MTIGLLHPGEMGAAIGAALVRAGQDVRWCPEGRSPETARRAADAGLIAVEDLAELVAASSLVISICPPHHALEVATTVAAASGGARSWSYLDANPTSPSTTRRIATAVEAAGGDYVDGGIIGPPPVRAGTTRFYLSGVGALAASEVLGTPVFEVHVISEQAGDASSLKLAYAAWTKGSAALLLAARAAAERAGVGEALALEWRTSLPELIDRHESATRSAHDKGWRWSGEMIEIASMFETMGLPTGFHEAAAEVFRRPPLP